MYVYKQSTGELYLDGNLLTKAYSGHGDGVNNPDMQNVPDVGPIPEGKYTIEEGFSHPKLGPLAMPLKPHPDNEMFGRAGFYMHGDNKDLNRSASHGCIIVGRNIRDLISEGKDRELTVIA